MSRRIVLSINTSWNIVNFRTGLISALQARGFEVVAVTPTDAHSVKLATLGVRHVPIAIDNKGISPLGDLALLRAYWRTLRKLRPAVYLGWTVKPNVYGSLAAHALGIPVINNVSGLGTAFIRTGLLTRIVSLLYRAAFSRSSTVFFQNPDDRDVFVQRRLVASKRVALLPGSGIDTVRFAPRPRNNPEGHFTFLLVARLLRDKGIGEFVEAARQIRRTRSGVRFQLLGALGAENRTAITATQIDQWVAEGVVEYLGQIDDVRPVMHAADCIVLPSYREGMPRALLEGAALAKPLIASDVPGCVEIARAGRNALLCVARNAASLRYAMLAMLDMPPLERDAMGATGRQIAESEFNEHIVVEHYIQALDKIIV